MLQMILWPILLIWMGIAVLITLSILGMLIWGTAHQLKDKAGQEGEVYCPVLKKTMKVRGVSRHTTALPEFADLQRCEQFGAHQVTCAKACIAEVERRTQAA